VVQYGRVDRGGLKAGPPSGWTRPEGRSVLGQLEHHKADCLKSRLALGFVRRLGLQCLYEIPLATGRYPTLTRALDFPTRITAMTYPLSLPLTKQSLSPGRPLMTPMGSPGRVEPRAQTWRPCCTIQRSGPETCAPQDA
jgi:hypothetical protein